MECPQCGREVSELYELEYGNGEVCSDCYFENIDIHEQALKGGE